MSNFADKSSVNRKLLFAVIGLSIVLVVVAVVFVASTFFGDSRSDDVFATCSEAQGGLTLDGETITSSNPGGAGERGTAYTRARGCLLAETGMPPSVEDRMMWTGTDVGKDDGQWEGWKASWTYDLDDGLVLSVTAD